MKYKRIIKKILGTCLAPMMSAKSALAINEAKAILKSASPCPTGTCIAHNTVAADYDMQIIIPAYNVEKYIAECLDSVVSQVTSYRFLATIVNDGSTDKTGEIISSYAKNREEGISCELEVITQDNKGLSGARNTGLRTIRGEYVMLLDSDDVLPPNTVQYMLDAAKRTKAALVQGSWYEFGGQETEQHVLPKDGVVENLQGVFSGFPWGKLYKHTVLEYFRFPEGFWFEDTPVSFILAAMPYRFAATKEMVYGYRHNPNGITATAGRSPKSIDSYWITERCLEEFPDFGLTYDQRAYEYLLRQSVMNWSRTKKQPREVREAIFVMTVGLIEHYFKGFHTNEKRMYVLENALNKRQFRKFELLAWGM